MEESAPTRESATTRTWHLRTAADTGGAVHEQRVEYAPGSPFPPAHYHPAQDELFEVEQGSMIYVVAGTERRVSTGERLELVAGTVHKARNASETEAAVVRWETRPALRSADFFTVADELDDTGMLEHALLADEYQDVFRVSGWMGALVPHIATLARLLGRRLPDI